MVKVFLVEDEIVVREGIKRNIDWEGNGFDFCGDERDGELAFAQIQRLKPDILITDIKMPFMDGIELSRLVKKEFPDTEIILLTGYEDFAYAKEGIEIGVAQYLTKPISGEDLLAEVKKVADKIREKKNERLLKEKYKQEMEERNKERANALFRNLVSGKLSMSEMIDEAKSINVDISAVCYNILLFTAQTPNKDIEAYSNSYVEFENRINHELNQLDIVLFDRDLDGVALLIKADTAEELSEKQQKITDILEKEAGAVKELKYWGGFGKPVNRMTELASCFEAASRAFSHRYFVNDSRIFDDSQVVDSHPVSEEFNVSSVDVNHVDKKRIEDFIKTGNGEEVEYFVNELSQGAGTNFTKSLIFRQYIVMNVYFTVAAFTEQLGYDRSELGNVDFNSEIVNNPDEATAFIKDILKKTISLRDNLASSRYKQTVDEAIEYIKDNYNDEELSLNSLASYVNVSPNHLSMIFSQQTGVTFIKFLTDYRMNKARELLKCTNMRSSEIAEEVGYHDPHYFSYSFKKMFGMTPTQYRGSND